MVNAVLASGWTLLAGAALALDDAAGVSLLISEPVFAGALFGALTGRFAAGVAAGALLQCLSLVTLRVGGARTPEGWLGAAAAVAALQQDVPLGGMAWLSAPSLTGPVATGIIFALLGRALRDVQRHAVAFYAGGAIDRASAGDASRAARLHAAAIVAHAARGAVAVLIAFAAAPRLAAVITAVVPDVRGGWIALGIGIVALGRVAQNRWRWSWVAGAALGALWVLW
jgi:mannose/fructose/N-acetylgalactosamine-specific phosphotransferase system component IIC